MATETDVINIALGKIGGAGDQESGTGLIASINSPNRVPSRAKLLFPRVRRRVIGDLLKLKTPFKETRIYADLGAEVTTTLKKGGWEFVFNLPGNTISVLRQIDEQFATLQTSITDRLLTYSHEVKRDGTTQLLFTNDLTNTAGDSAFVDIVFDQTNVGAWTEEFIDAVATLLGAELAPTVGSVEEDRQRLLAEYLEVSIPKAMAANQAQDAPFTRQVADYKGGRNESIVAVNVGQFSNSIFPGLRIES